MAARSARYTIGFAAAICVVCSVLVSASAVVLKPRQQQNIVLDRQRKVLEVAGLVGLGESLDSDEVERRFRERVRPVVIDARTGADAVEVDVEQFDPRRNARDPQTSHPAAENAAGILRVPNQALLYHVVDDGEFILVVLPIEGKGLWSTLYGYLALGSDGETIQGITFYEHGETPGLGGEVDSPAWQGLWRGRLAYADESDDPAIRVIKGHAGRPEADPHRVDGITGATITSRGVSELVRFWLGPDGHAPYLRRIRHEEGPP